MKNIEFYGANWCPYCVQLRFALDKEDIPYEYRSVDDAENEKLMLQATDGRYLIPTVVVDGKAMQNPPLAMVKQAIHDL